MTNSKKSHRCEVADFKLAEYRQEFDKSLDQACMGCHECGCCVDFVDVVEDVVDVVDVVDVAVSWMIRNSNRLISAEIWSM